MANRRPQGSGRRMDFGRNDRGNNFRGGVSPWQGGGPGGDLPNLLPLGGPTEATLALASNLINLLQPRQNPVPSLLDMPIRRDFGPSINRYDRGYGPNRMGNQGNFRRTGNYNRAGERINNNRKPFRPSDGQRQQNKSSPRKDADFKARSSKESEEPSDKKEDKKDSSWTRFDDISQQLLRCHICNKSMWDGRSFENHLNGRAHAIMMQKTSESYALTADTMRQEFKIREMKRTRKTGQQPHRDFYCAMCDMYAADGAIHRTTVGHRKLKKFLHPACTSCHKEMPTRIELDEHRLTAEHLKQLQDKQDANVAKPRPEMMMFSTLAMEQVYLRDDRRTKQSGETDKDAKKVKDSEEDVRPLDDQTADGEQDQKQEESGDQEMKEVGDVDETKKDKEAEEETEENKAAPTDTEDTILDYKEGDDLSNITQEMLPAYNADRSVGQSFLKPLNCVQCKLCHKLLDSQETADVHLRTWRHHQLFINLLNEKSGNMSDPQQSETGKRSHSNYNDDSGTWKRRRTSPRDEDDEEQDEVEPEPEPEPVKRNGHNDEDQDASMGEVAKINDALNIDGDDGYVPTGDEDLEDWEQSVDEILNDENVTVLEKKEPVKVESVKVDPVKVEPVKVEPAKVEPVKVEPEKNEPEKKEPMKKEVEVIDVMEEMKKTFQSRTPRGRGRGRRMY